MKKTTAQFCSIQQRFLSPLLGKRKALDQSRQDDNSQSDKGCFSSLDKHVIGLQNSL